MATSKSYKQNLSVNGIYSADLTGTSNGNSNLSMDSQMAMEQQARGIYDRNSMGWDKNFSRIGIIDPYNTTMTTTEYVFFVKPDLRLFNNGVPNPELVNRSSFFSDAIDRYPHIARQLQFSESMNTAGGVLSPLLTNALSGSLDLPGISADTIETPQTVYGTKIDYRGSSYKSDEGFDFSLDFKDTKYLEIYMWFKMYDEYEKMKWRGQVTPKDIYITYKNLHDQMAIYKFIVGDDGMSLIYWARLMGVFPTSVPRDTFGKLDAGEITYNTNWHAQFVRDMDPGILSDFNNITAPYRRGRSDLPLYDETNHRFNPTWARCPYITARRGTTSFDKLNKYYFMWAA